MSKIFLILTTFALCSLSCKQKEERYIAPQFKENEAANAGLERKECAAGEKLDASGNCVAPPPPDICDPGVPVIMVLDISHSMIKPELNPDSSDTRMDKARRAAVNFIGQLLEGDYLAVVTYESKAEIVSDWSKDLAKVKEKVEKIEGSPPGKGKDAGYTNMYDGLDKAWELYERAPSKDSKPVMLFLSDGKYELFEVKDPHKDKPLDPVIEKFSNAKVPIWTLGFGEAAKDELTKITVAPGTYQDGGDGSGLEKIFANVAKDLCRDKK
jgi:uncharacterized protein YegL